MSVSVRAVTTAAAAALLAVGAYLGAAGVLVVAALVVLALAYGWPRLVGSPAPLASGAVIGLAGLVGLGFGYFAAGAARIDHLPLVAAFALCGGFLVEMLRRDGRTDLVGSLTGTVAGVMVALGAAGWLAVVAHDEWPGATAYSVIAAAALAVSAVCCAFLWRRAWVAAIGALAAGCLVGLVTGLVVVDVSWWMGLILGLVMGLVAASAQVLLGKAPGINERYGALAAALAPVAVSGVLVWVARALAG